MTALGRITIYPIKSLDGLQLDDVAVLPSGSLQNDRRWALLDADGKYINGKRTAAVQRIRADFDLTQLTVRFGDHVEFSLINQKLEIGKWLSESLGIPCKFIENPSTGFPDDTDAPGPTVISSATLEEVTHWFPGITLDEARRRFRANLEVTSIEPFWEDRLVGPTGSSVPFQIGSMHWLGMNSCQRCVVPTRNAISGETTPGFQKIFAIERKDHLPEWAPAERFNHFYRLAVNTRLVPGQRLGLLRIGDCVLLE